MLFSVVEQVLSALLCNYTVNCPVEAIEAARLVVRQPLIYCDERIFSGGGERI